MGNPYINKIKNDAILAEYSDSIIESYINDPNVSELIEKYGATRTAIVKLLKQNGIYKGFSSSQFSRSEKRKRTLKERFGVENMGQTPLMREALMERNKRTKTENPIEKQSILYKKNVDRITNRNKKLLFKSRFCYYTGVLLKDSSECNPNDPFIRTLDHKVSVMEGFLRRIDPEIIGGVSNLVFCARYCNSLKGNTSAIEFKSIAQLLREEFINAGLEHN